MIEVQKQYKLTLTEDQARQLYDLLRTEKDCGGLGTVAPKTQLHIKMDEPVKYETPMTENEEEIEKVKAQIKVLEKKLSFLEELEKTKSPVEEAYKDWWGQYPKLETDSKYDVIRWQGFQAGYNAADGV